MEKAIYFDMDGTIVDLYSVPMWREALNHNFVRPYVVAKPLVNMSRLAYHIHQVQAKGYKVGIISWTSRTGGQDYQQAIKEEKLLWLAHHMPSVTFDEIYIVPYGTRKSQCAHFPRGILFDDNIAVLSDWEGDGYLPRYIFEVLKALK